ncbi:NrdH-redoxin [Clostridium tyrobutyricum]|jgi:glutaredoxin-like YruB-family protein|uniref:Glutaredoxin n=1 Tax=Clostridium tyrobutyricum DIVETGP TaxID=1408889 RepID=W6N896_CLOTY|nr:glutaredoxin domain-containing protein [Clostridium tyrobutyricum]AND84535.1 glutaredoxin [Clostridium tyrobutyricum]ANP69147.1 NrdH-redoxin [Clostridium tyrobutyricum]MBR9647638.1 thioredoxin family protein [Clostridium tyrobutyricum]MBV4415522.1 thioredoxin family protein [Clostridium tyrobutyricum]MBV4421397.1 thioredoxin family protein [Clostridium tyrobutyricum]
MSKVDIFTSSTCQYCHAAKEFFKENNVDYVEHNITTDAEARKDLMKKGYRGVPVIVIDGEYILGFDQNKVSDILGI